MKKLLYIFIVLFLCTLTNANPRYKYFTDYQENKKKGTINFINEIKSPANVNSYWKVNVKKENYRKAEWFLNNNRKVIIIFTYNNKIKEWIQYENNNIKVIYKYEYNDNGNKFREYVFNPDKTLIIYYTYKYDSHGNIVETLSQTGKGDVIEHYKRD